MKQSGLIKTHLHFEASLRFELFFALQTLLDDKSRIHSDWKERTRLQLPKEFWKAWKATGESPELLAFISDTLRTKPLELTFEQIIHEIKTQDIASFQWALIEGSFHNDALARKIIDGKLTLKEAASKVPKVKQEWLIFTGLYPYQAGSPIIMGMESLIKSPESFRKNIIQMLKSFWDSSFKEAWQRIQPQLKRSLEEKERLFESCSFDEFAKQALLRIEVDSKKEVIKAIRGGFELPFKKLKNGFLIPSLFNDKRFWTCFEEKDGLTTAYFPYFDPSITLNLSVVGSQSLPTSPELDATLIFKALGDTTRYAIVKLIANKPKSAVELAKQLSVSKPTISHHVHVLREAGLIHENYLGGFVMLSLKREVFENLSTITISKVFDENPQIKSSSKRSRP